MIYDTLAHAAVYYGVDRQLKRALEFLEKTDFSALADGRVEIDGERIWANISRGKTLPENPQAEAHRSHIDVQYLIEGREVVAVAPLESLTETQAHPERDYWLYTGRLEPLSLGAGRFLVLWPQDAHAPGIAPGGIPEDMRKCVVKIKL